ncbi:hypothetical protein EJ03DRAFT_360582 [Teratosphaeria nubilosa]|uniref:Uncharacterized protein n=1 Tax=Teratosphaeria nubilosa TaxID=161662 RepID=A0A6G1LC67_9PEZI|nr:hypothetical protein EJ03DRAFT_360582 [Teratosphaeria nubilosa]
MEPASEHAVVAPQPKSRHNYRRRKPTNVELDEAKKTDLYMGHGVYSSVKVTLDGSNNTILMQHFAWNKTALAAYSGFDKLYDQSFQQHQIPRPAGGAQKLHLHFRAGPQNGLHRLSPKTTTNRSNGAARHHHLTEFSKNTHPYLKLLRTCKQISPEASPILFGEVEFRFTSIKGYYVLNTFLRQIGSINQSLLRKITIHIPFPGHIGEGPLCPDYWPKSVSQLAKMRGILTGMGLHPRAHNKAFSHTTCVRRANSIFEAHGKLKSLRLILPDTYMVADAADEGMWAGKTFGSMVPDVEKFAGGLDVTLVRLHGGFSATFFDQSLRRSERRSCLQTQVQVKKYAQEQG